MSKVGFEIGVQKSITQISENEASFVIVNSPQKKDTVGKKPHQKKILSKYFREIILLMHSSLRFYESIT